jgi:outer membrane lipoprotein SlyB
MHPSTAIVPQRPAKSHWPRSVWVVIGLMAATVAALAAAIVWRNPADARQEPSAPLALAAGTAPTPSSAPAPAADASDSMKPPPIASASHPSGAGGGSAAPLGGGSAAQPGAAALPNGRAPRATPGGNGGAPLATQPAVVSVCKTCGVVEAVEAVQRQGKASGVGAVAGGVVGGALGNRMGAGSGKTAMTVLGAIGGGFAGNAIEKRAKAETVYRVKVRMEDGSVHTVTRAQTVAVGSRVTLQGQVLKVTAPPAAVAAAGSHA